jgi:hypothetical protein
LEKLYIHYLWTVNGYEFLISIGRMTEDEAHTKTNTDSEEPESRHQTVGDVFDLIRAIGYTEKLPGNCHGINAGKWKTQK